jgi:hypothetical protein
MLNNIINYDAVVSVRQSEKGNTYLRIWHPEYGAVIIADRASFNHIVRAAGGWQASNLINVPKKGQDGEWLDLQFRGVFSLELKLRFGDNCCFATVLAADKQKAFTVAIPKGIATQDDSAEEPAPAPAPASTRRRREIRDI